MGRGGLSRRREREQSSLGDSAGGGVLGAADDVFLVVEEGLDGCVGAGVGAEEGD